MKDYREVGYFSTTDLENVIICDARRKTKKGEDTAVGIGSLRRFLARTKDGATRSAGSGVASSAFAVVMRAT